MAKKPHIRIFNNGTYFTFSVVTYREDGTERYTKFNQEYTKVMSFFGPNNGLKYLKVPICITKDSLEYKKWKKKMEELKNDE